MEEQLEQASSVQPEDTQRHTDRHSQIIKCPSGSRVMSAINVEQSAHPNKRTGKCVETMGAECLHDIPTHISECTHSHPCSLITQSCIRNQGGGRGGGGRRKEESREEWRRERKGGEEEARDKFSSLLNLW